MTAPGPSPSPSPAPIDGWLAVFPSMAPLREQLVRGASSEAPLLVVGEPGVGRSTLARALHAASRRAAGPLVELDVGSVPVDLFESELFGHRAGSFTGAARDRRGRVAEAEGGTLVLDRVEELPIEIQPKLLRLLAERVYAPLGGREIAADVRFVSVASEDLDRRVARGDFREDLYYRLEVIAFEVPPLRRRAGDLAVAAPAILEDLRRRYGRGELRLAEEDLDWMRGYSWPGNLRQLRNLLERAVVLQQQGELRVARPGEGSRERPGTLHEVEARAIRDALSYTRGHQGRAAELLGISRKGLWEKRKRHRIP
ncbi:MAG TPA: sigma 54-interacting transcriptional regulator [Thermoanaerobaculia bacterium]|nr:sigma 54-interacting transcriptional regulator [Thermoanaerobaculia bacterium]